jgi:hypothetical protein
MAAPFVFDRKGNQMDLRQYFKKIKDTEALIEDQYPLLVSLETTDGGKPGAIVEVSRQEAARAIVENRAVLASADQKTAHHIREAARRKLAEKAELTKRLQIAIVSDSEFRAAAVDQDGAEEPESSR